MAFTVASLVLALVASVCRPCAALPPAGATTLCSADACYSAHAGTNTNFEASQRRCEAGGGHLATVRGADEAALLERLVSGGASWPNLWIGLRKRRKQCSDMKKPQRGFEWVSGDEATDFSKWLRADAGSCVQELCVHTAAGLAWKVRECGNARNVGFVCKYRYAGMCPRLAVLGPGRAEYTTPFGVVAGELSEVPPGSTAVVTCAGGRGGAGGVGGGSEPLTATCRDKGADGFGWSQDVFTCEGGEHEATLDAGTAAPAAAGGERPAGRHPPETSKPAADPGEDAGGKRFVDDDDEDEDEDEDDDLLDADSNTEPDRVKEGDAGGGNGLGGVVPNDHYDQDGGGGGEDGHDDQDVSGHSKNVAIIAVVTLVLVTVIIAVLLVLLLRFCNKQRSHSAAKHKATKIPAAKTDK